MKKRPFLVAFKILVTFRCVVPLEAGEPIGIISTSSGLSISGGVASHTPSISADGRQVVFTSHAKNLTTNSSLTPYLDVFVHDLVTSNTTLVSVNSSVAGSGDGDSAYPSVSSDGRFVAFASRARNLVVGDTNEAFDVFLRDVQSGITTLVSASANGAAAAGSRQVLSLGGFLLRNNLNFSGNPSISADGRWVAFESSATNLLDGLGSYAVNDIFIRDTLTGVTRLLSADASDYWETNSPFELPTLTPNAKRVAFVAYAGNLLGIGNNRGDAYVRDLETNTTVWVSTNLVQHFGSSPYRCYSPLLSTNGQVLAFKASADLLSGALFHVDLTLGISTLIHSNSPVANGARLSDDGRFLAYDDGTNIYVWDNQARSNLLVSTRFDGSGTGNGFSRSPVLSANGRTVAFVSAATDLVSDYAADTNALFQIYARDLQTGVTRLLTADGNGQPVRANHHLANISLSADGTRIAFDSRSGDLVPDDGNRESDVFVVDLAKNETRLVSRRVESRPSGTAARQVRIAPDCVSTNGRYLLFASVLKSSPGDDTFCCANLLIRDLLTGVEEPITDLDVVDLKEFVLSADARHVAYITRAIAGVRSESVVLLNPDTGVTVMANRDPFGAGLLAGPFGGLTLSPAGDRVAYIERDYVCLFDSTTAINRRMNTSAAPYTARFSPDGRRLVFGDLLSRGLSVYDILTNGVSLIWLTNVSSGFAMPHTFSADSRYVAASKPWLEIFDLEDGTFRTVGSNSVRNPVLSANGVWVAYEENPSQEGAFNITVRNLQTGATKLVTRNLSGTGSGNGRSKSVGLSPDGRFVVFSSRASDLVPGDTNALSDVFAYDVITGTTFLLSKNRDGTSSGNAASSVPILGADGRTVIFQSFADDLVPGDYNFASDIFIARLGGMDSDGDGMDDGWEMAYFESLARNGAGDLDADGITDRQEFLAGTDPTNLGSVLRVITVEPMSGGQRTVLWASAPGRAYRVQFKDAVEAVGWTDLPGVVTATGSTASMLDATASLAHRFYRVVLP